MVEFWIMIVVASSSGTSMTTGQPYSPPAYYTRELCSDAAKDIKTKTGTEYMCVPARPVVNMQMNGIVVYGIP